MYFCVGTFLTALKICKATSVKQKLLGKAVFCSLYPGFDSGDDDSSISAVFRGKRNLHSYLQIMVDDLETMKVVANFEKWVLPLLDENKFSFLIRLIQNVIAQDTIEDETHVELVNKIKKKDLVQMDEVVLGEFLVGTLFYAMKNTDNLNKEAEVKKFKAYACEFLSEYKQVIFIDQYSMNPVFHDGKIRSAQTIYKQSGNLIDVVYADLFDICEGKEFGSKVNIVIPVNTTFETKFEEKTGDIVVPLVSENTIHGQWLDFLHKRGIRMSEADILITKSLKKNGITKCGSSASGVGKQDIFPIASIANISIENVDFYLVAVARFEETNRAISNVDNIKKSLNTVIDFYDREGQGFDLYIPLIGSERSRTGLSSNESYELIKNMLLARKNDIYGRVHIVIRPNQMDEIEVEK